MTTFPTGDVSFLITDVEGSTKLYHRLGPGYEDLLEAHRDICRDAFAAHGGVEVACPGDGFIVAFESASDALGAAVAAQRRLAGHSWPPEGELRVRMGVHTGEARLTSTGGTYLGIGLHEAARVGDAGCGGQIVVSGTTYELVGDGTPADVELAPLGVHRLRGFEGVHRLYEARGPGLPGGFPPLRIESALAGNLPPDPFELVGRDAMVAEVVASVQDRRVTTLTGPGGVGKTRLATVAAGHLVGRFADGCWFVDLTALADGASPDDLAVVLGASVSVDVSYGVAGLAAALGRRSMLLVLDNCEHVLPAAAAVTSALVDAGPGLKVLATSRAPLGLHGERLVPLEPLELADAAALFVLRAHEVEPSAPVSALDPDVLRLCEQIDALPLAVELAARRIRALSPRDIADRLDDRFSLLKGGARDLDRRQQTLEATIDWSHELLDDAERLLLRRLSVFAGGAELASIEAVCSGDGVEHHDVVDLVTALVDRSLVRVVRGGTARYSMLRSVHAYAHRQLERAGELDRVRSRHLAHFAERSWDTLWASHRGTLADELGRMVHEAENLRAAVGWALGGGSPEEGLRLACGAAFFGRDCDGGYLYASRRWIEDLLALGAAADDPALRCQALVSSANVSVAEGDWARVADAGEAALALVEAAGLGAVLRAQALGMVGIAAEQAHPLREVAAFDRALVDQQAPDATVVPTRQPADAVGLLQDAADLAGREGLAGYRVHVLTNVASAALQVGQGEAGRHAAETALAEARQLGLGAAMARALNRLAYAAMQAGDFAGGGVLAEEALAAAIGSGSSGELAATHTTLAGQCALRGDGDAAREHAVRARELFASLGHWVPVARMWAAAASLFYPTGRVDLARESMDNLAEAVRLVGAHPSFPVLLGGLVPQAEAAGHHDVAAALRPFVDRTG